MNRTGLILTFLSSLFLLSGCDSMFESETVEYSELIERDSLFYKKYTHVPYTGRVSGKEQGSIKKGKREGEWYKFYENGQLKEKSTYKNGEEIGEIIAYYENGQLKAKVGGNKDNEPDGDWV